MKLAKILGMFLLTIVIVGLAFYIFFDSGQQPVQVTKPGQQKFISPRSADDPTYGQELRSLTATVKSTERQMQYRDQLREKKTNRMQNDINQLSQKVQSLNNDGRLNEVEDQIKKIGEQGIAAQKDNQLLQDQLEKITHAIDELKNQQQAKDQAIASLTAQLQQTGNNPDATLNIEEQVKTLFNKMNQSDQSVNNPGQVTTANTDPSIYTSTPVRSSYDHKPYGTDAKIEGNTVNLAGLLGNITNEPLLLPNNRGSSSKTKAVKPITKFPVYTLPATTMLTDSVLLTPLIGRVPIRGNVNDPFRFQAEIGADNLAANGHRIPGIRKAIVAGIATGIREQSCVRGLVTTMTFIFEDGRIHNVSQNSNNAKGGLGYLADPWGKPCIRGEYINNAGSYLKDRSLAAFLDGLASAYAQSQVEHRETSAGYINTFVTGNTYEFAAAQGLSNTAEEIADYVRQRAQDAFDVVYVPQAKQVQIILQNQINIDYDTKGRKTSYLNNTRGVTYD